MLTHLRASVEREALPDFLFLKGLGVRNSYSAASPSLVVLKAYPATEGALSNNHRRKVGNAPNVRLYLLFRWPPLARPFGSDSAYPRSAASNNNGRKSALRPHTRPDLLFCARPLPDPSRPCTTTVARPESCPIAGRTYSWISCREFGRSSPQRRPEPRAVSRGLSQARPPAPC